MDKEKIYILLIAILLMLTACNKSNDISIEQTEDAVEVAFSTQLLGEGFTKADNYERGNAPDWVEDMRIIATNTTYPEFGIVDSTFTFVHPDSIKGTEPPLAMTVKTGWNTFDATASSYMFPGAGYGSGVPKLDWSDPTYDTFEERAEAYNDYLLSGGHPLHAIYKGSTDHEIYFDQAKNTVPLQLAPQNGRVNIFFETDQKDLYFKLHAEIMATHPVSGEVFIANELGPKLYNKIDTGTYAYTFNDAKQFVYWHSLEPSYIAMSIWKTPASPLVGLRDTTILNDDTIEWKLVTDLIKIETQIGYIITHVYNYTGSGTVSGDFTIGFASAFQNNYQIGEITKEPSTLEFSISYSDFTDDNRGAEIYKEN